MQIHYCDTCGTRVTEEQVRSGGAVVIGEACFCSDCAEDAKGKYGGDPGDSTRNAGAPVPARRRSRSGRVGTRARGPASSSKMIGVIVIALAGVAAVLAVISLRGSAPKESGAGGSGGGSGGTGGYEEPKPPTPEAGVEKPQAEPEAGIKPTRRPLGEGLPTPKIEPRAVPKAQPGAEPKPEPKVEPKPEPEPEAKAAPVTGEWISIFNGKDLKGWQKRDARAFIEEGALVSTSDADVYYPADWGEFIFEFEVMNESQKERGDKDSSVCGVSVGHYDRGRGGYAARMRFHTDGDAHAAIKGGKTWRAGGGKFPLGKWHKVRLELRKDGLKVYREGGLLGTLTRAEGPLKKGGVFFYSYKNCTARMRNMRVKVLSR